MTQPIPTHVETPRGSYVFYSEENADLKTTEGRLAWFCARYELDVPELEYDPDEPDQLLMQDALLDFSNREGVSLDWLVLGHVSCLIATYRERHRVTPESKRLGDLIGKLDPQEIKILLAGLKMVTEQGADHDDVLATVNTAIEEYRAGHRATDA